MTAGRARRPSELTRKVFFYRCWSDDEEGQKTPVDAELVQKSIARRNAAHDRYQVVEDGEVACVWTHEVDGRAALRLGRIRHRGLPWVEEEGRVTPLAMLEQQGLVEQTHMVFFGGGVVGVELNCISSIWRGGLGGGWWAPAGVSEGCAKLEQWRVHWGRQRGRVDVS
jgi:hypothetical protein